MISFTKFSRWCLRRPRLRELCTNLLKEHVKPCDCVNMTFYYYLWSSKCFCAFLHQRDSVSRRPQNYSPPYSSPYSAAPLLSAAETLTEPCSIKWSTIMLIVRVHQLDWHYTFKLFFKILTDSIALPDLWSPLAGGSRFIALAVVRTLMRNTLNNWKIVLLKKLLPWFQSEKAKIITEE